MRGNDATATDVADASPFPPAVSQLLAQMTLAEKARQLDLYNGWDMLDNGQFSPAKASAMLGTLGMGVLQWGRDQDVRMANILQQACVNSSRLGVPALLAEECLHGVQGDGHTVFPSPLSFAATFDAALAHDVGRVIGTEARAQGTAQCWSPVCGVAREPRWGRTEEELGEDTHLAATLAGNLAFGMTDGKNLTSPRATSPLLKHFAGYSAPEGGRNAAPTHAGRRELLSDFLPVFASAVANGAQGVMASYNQIDNVPTAGDEWLLTEVLRGQMDFDGYVSSDFGAIHNLLTVYATAATPGESIVQFLSAGGSVQGHDYDHDYYQTAIVAMVKNGTMPQSVLDTAAGRVLTVKDRLGLLAQPYTDESLLANATGANPDHVAVARQAALEAMTLLNNSAGVLPLHLGSSDGTGGGGEGAIAKVAVIGPNADYPRMGDYAAGGWTGGTPAGGGNINNANTVPVLEGIKKAAAAAAGDVTVEHAVGTGITAGKPTPYVSTVHRHHWVGDGVNASYFANTGLQGTPALVRKDAEINFHWMSLGPVPAVAGLQTQNFSVRWTGQVVCDAHVEAGSWSVLLRDMPSGVRLTVDGKVVIDAWTYQPTTLAERDVNAAVRGRHAGAPMAGGSDYAARNTTSGPFAFEPGVAMDVMLEYWQGNADGSGSSWPYVALQWDLLGAGPDDGLPNAVAAALRSDVAIVVVGGSTEPAPQATEGEGVDRAALSLPGNQLELVQHVWNATQAATPPIPMVLVLVQGKPLAEPWVRYTVPTVLEAWQAGQAQGDAVAAVLTGAHNPAGRLPISFPASSAVLPVYYNHAPSAKRGGYVDFPGKTDSVLWPFGYGLSYTSFEYSGLSVSPASAGVNDTVIVAFTVHNTGTVDGEEVAQLYVRDLVASVSTPIIRLVGFERVSVPRGGSVLVKLPIDVASQLALVDRNYEWTVEAGDFRVFVGGASNALPLNATFAVV